PLRLGGGMRVKVLETLAAGKALVASPRALEGLRLEPGREVLQAESDAEFCEAISELLANEERRISLGRSARVWAEANLGWERVAVAFLLAACRQAAGQHGLRRGEERRRGGGERNVSALSG